LGVFVQKSRCVPMKKLAILMSVLMLIGLTAGLCPAEEKALTLEMLSGKVVNIDNESGTIVILAADQAYTLTAEPKLLEGIAPGERVDIEIAGDVLKSIKKVDAPAVK
jgi:hypothetical protein